MKMSISGGGSRLEVVVMFPGRHHDRGVVEGRGAGGVLGGPDVVEGLARDTAGEVSVELDR